MNCHVNFVFIFISLLSFINISGCADTKGVFASSASSASLGSVSASSASSHSSESISGSVDSVFRSSSQSSPGDDQYTNEIADLTSAFVHFAAAQSDYQAFQNGISEIASRNGVVNWESYAITYIAIGKGLKKAKLTGAGYEIYKQLLADSDYAKMQDIEKGYTAE